MHAGKEGTAAPFPPFAISFQVQGRRTHSRGRGQFSPLPPLAGAFNSSIFCGSDNQNTILTCTRIFFQRTIIIVFPFYGPAIP